MKGLRVLAIAIGIYVGVVLAFESLIGLLQPADASTLVITTTDADGNSSERVLSRLESGGQLYVAANHWPRRWYRQALANPDVMIAMDGGQGAFRAVSVIGAERDRVDEENDTGLAFRILVGFAPRKFVRLDPR